MKNIIVKGMTAHNIFSNDRTKQDACIHEQLEMVGLNTEMQTASPMSFLVARALAVDPQVIICDESHQCLGRFYSGAGGQSA